MVLEIEDDTNKLAKILIINNVIPKEYLEDALHIAVAAVNGIDVIVTWNFKHINNPFTRMVIRRVVENNGYVCPKICLPNKFF